MLPNRVLLTFLIHVISNACVNAEKNFLPHLKCIKVCAKPASIRPDSFGRKSTCRLADGSQRGLERGVTMEKIYSVTQVWLGLVGSLDQSHGAQERCREHRIAKSNPVIALWPNDATRQDLGTMLTIFN